MKEESVLDVLMYLFENYMDEESHLQVDPDELKEQLHEAGFDSAEIGKAFVWLEGLSQNVQETNPLKFNTLNPIRVYAREECDKIDLPARGYLMFLGQIGVLDATNRELVIDRIMALENTVIDLEQVKWIILMVLFNQPEFEEAFNWVEQVVLDDHPNSFH